MTHKQCNEYGAWKKQHPGEHKLLVEEVSRLPRSVYIPVYKTTRVHDRDVRIVGGIKSIDPPCLEEAVPHGNHPFRCSNCAKQERELKNTLQHRRRGSLQDTKNRLGLSGFNKRYARRGELEDALEKEKSRLLCPQKQINKLAKVKHAPKEMEACLLDCCISGDEQKLVIDLIRLFKSGFSKTKPVQILVLQNLVSKLLKNNNHHYASLIKDLSGPFKNELGPTNYSLLGWNPNAKRWHLEEVAIPRKDIEKGDKDDFSALKRYIDELIENDSLAKTYPYIMLNALHLWRRPVSSTACGQQ